MSCMFLPTDCGSPSVQPVPPQVMDALRADGLAAMNALYPSVAQAKPAAGQYLGASVRPDGRPFYLTLLAPDDAAVQKDAAWQGAFYAPCGFFHVAGLVEGGPHAADASLLTVSAALVLDGREHVAARWSVVGPNPGVVSPNKEAMIRDISIAAGGPHEEKDLRSCIARHAPLCAWGVPRVAVASQCGVAMACLIEAVC